MTNSENGPGEDEIRDSKVWEGSVMKGTWDGNGIWQEDGKWTGNGTWQGGLLSGTWNVKGKWKPSGNSRGEWKGDGKIECNVSFEKYTVRLVTVIVFISSIVVAALKLSGILGWSTTIMLIVVPVLLAIVGIIAVQKTTRGKLWVEGTWTDYGEFRVLYMHGGWKLGFHGGIIKGIMKDPKPS